MKVHAIDDSGMVTEYDYSPVSEEKELEDYIEKNPEIIEKGLMILKRQYSTGKGFIDLLGLDYDGNVVVIEIKKESNDARKVITQAIEYGIWAEETLGYSELNAIARENNKLENFSNLELMFQNRNDDFQSDDFNSKTKMYIVHEKIGDEVKKIAQWLSSKNISIHCIELNFHEKDGKKIAVQRNIVGETKLMIKSKTEKEEFSEESHTQNGYPETKEMYASLRGEVMKLGTDVDVYGVKYYIGFKRHQRFLSVRIKRHKLVLQIRQFYNGQECFSIKNTEMKQAARDKDWSEIHINNIQELESILEVIGQSYNANKK